ncbi:hypothetical protein O9K51_04957 [Purpureocillium lavendulum]|uniref:Uncharacterized protein n=1 Tax=Purpureocillium lavendulum TaxID=1247861 RepID=A0AB34FSR2_9HYPO|nr:hypothetical protein O9K51_04957 [Purpureocillium lavendulum]
MGQSPLQRIRETAVGGKAQLVVAQVGPVAQLLVLVLGRHLARVGRAGLGRGTRPLELDEHVDELREGLVGLCGKGPLAFGRVGQQRRRHLARLVDEGAAVGLEAALGHGAKHREEVLHDELALLGHEVEYLLVVGVAERLLLVCSRRGRRGLDGVAVLVSLLLLRLPVLLPVRLLLRLLLEVDVAEVIVQVHKVEARGELRDKDVCLLDLVLELPPAERLGLDDGANVVRGLGLGPHRRDVLQAGLVETGEGAGVVDDNGVVVELQFGGQVVDYALGGEETVAEEEALVGPRERAHAIRELEADDAVHGGVDVDGEAEACQEGDAAFGLVDDLVGEDADVVDILGVRRVGQARGRRRDDEVGVGGAELREGSHAEEQAPKDALADLVLDVVEGQGVGRVEVVAKGRQVAGMLGAAEAELADEGECLGHELARGVPLMDVARGEAEEVAGGGVVERLGLLEHPLGAAREQGDVAALFDHDDGLGEQMGAVLGLEVLAGAAGKGGDESGDHAGQQAEELGPRTVLAVGKGLPEGGLVGEGGERVDVGEEVVDEQLEDGHGRDCLGVEEGVGGDVDEGLGGRLRRGGRGSGTGRGGDGGGRGGCSGCGGGRGREELEAGALGRLGRLGVPVRGPAALRLALVGAVDAELAAGPAGDVCVVALDLAHAAHVAGASQAGQLGVDGGIAHHGGGAGRGELLLWRRRLRLVMGMLLLLLLLVVMVLLQGIVVVMATARLGSRHGLCGGGGGILEGLRLGVAEGVDVADGLGGVAGGLQDLEAIAGVGVGGGVLLVLVLLVLLVFWCDCDCDCDCDCGGDGDGDEGGGCGDADMASDRREARRGSRAGERASEGHAGPGRRWLIVGRCPGVSCG